MDYVSKKELEERFTELDREIIALSGCSDPRDIMRHNELCARRAEVETVLAWAKPIMQVTGLPASIQEALNSGDGIYRP